jgi:hypothetical protein
MKSFGRGLVALIILVAVGMIGYPYLKSFLGSGNSGGGQPSPSPVAESPSPSPSPSPSDHFPVPSESEQAGAGLALKPVPSLDNSDETIQATLSDLFGKERFESLFNFKDIVRRIVVSIDNLAKREQPPQEFSPFKERPRDFRVTGKGDERTINPTNFKRYDAYAGLVQGVDTQKLAAVYFHFYPLFQAAYQDLGTQGYFNDRLIKVLDMMIATPDVDGPIKVIRKSVHEIYKYADDRLEALPAVEKILIRTGPENVAIVKAKARELRAVLTQHKH